MSVLPALFVEMIRNGRGNWSPYLMTSSSGHIAELQPSRVCIIKPSSLGDVIHALPILAALRGRWPSAHLAWVVNDSFRDVLKGHTDLDELIVYERADKSSDPRGTIGLFRKLLSSGFDLSIDLQGLLRSALMTAATRAKVRVGLADAREGARWFYTDVVDAPRLGLHAVERIQRVAVALQLDATQPRFNLPIQEADRRWARGVMATVKSPRIVLNVGARWETKRWPAEHFAEIGRRAAQEFDAGLIAVGSEGDRPLVDQLLRCIGGISVLDLCGKTRLMQLAALASECDLMISNDTGPLHLAAAAGARVVGIYTCTSPGLTGPFGPRIATARSCIWCAPSFIKKCHRLDCMAELTPNRVWPIVKAQFQPSITLGQAG
jgi:lipopolysaccharide heptosyltransferase I